jgi:deazaflavin-dependent oxidoreductase (nitroreductase family)
MTITTARPTTGEPGIRYLTPGRGDAAFNRIVAWLVGRGVSVAGARRLSVVGRSSGELRTTVVNLLELDGVRYLVAPRGHTQWVRNLRVAGEGTLTVGRRQEPFVAEELADADKGPVLAAYLDRWAWEVGRFFENLDKDSEAEVLAAAAPDFPVFRVIPSTPTV